MTQKNGSNGKSHRGEHSADLKLVEEILQGHPDAEEMFLSRMRCVPLILESKNARTGSPLDKEDLSDLVQDTLAVVWRKLGTYAGRSSLETWVYAYCVNQLMNAIRSRQRLPLPIEDSEGVARIDPAVLDRQYDEFELVDRCIDRLEAYPAEVIRMKFFDDMTFNQIGTTLGIPENSAKTHYYRGMNRLRALMQPLLDED